MSTVVVVDYGMGNLRSVAKAIEHVAPRPRFASVPMRPRSLPPIASSFPVRARCPTACASWLARGLRDAVVRAAAEKPFLGICVGQQMLFGHAEEGDVMGLEVLPGSGAALSRSGNEVADGNRLKVPHMGWNRVHQAEAHPLWQGIADDARFYFVHSYYVEPAESGLIAGSTRLRHPLYQRGCPR
jgi:glutamine amidotransferase